MDCSSCSLILSISFSLSSSKICSLFGRFSMSFFSLRLCLLSILHSSSTLFSLCFSWSIYTHTHTHTHTHRGHRRKSEIWLHQRVSWFHPHQSPSELITNVFSSSFLTYFCELKRNVNVHLNAFHRSSVPLAAGLGSSWQPCSSPRSAWRTSWPVCSFRPSLSAARRCRCSFLLSAYCTLGNQPQSLIQSNKKSKSSL